MYAVSICAEGDCFLYVPPDPGIEAPALGASESAAPGAGDSALSGTTSAQVLHTFTLDSGASRSFFRDRTTLTPLSRPVAVSLADPSGGPVLAHYSTVLPCPAAPSGSLSGLYLPSFSTNLVSGADLQDEGVDQFTPASQRVTHCTCARTGRHLATFTRRPGSSLYTLTTESPPVAASGQVAASIQVLAVVSRSGPESAPCSCPLLSHQTLLWHHRLGVTPVLVFSRAVPCDITFDESVPYYRLFPYCAAPLPPPPALPHARSPPVDPLPPQGPAPSGVSQVDAVKLVEVAVDSGASRGAEPVGAGSGGAEPERAEPGGARPGSVELERATRVVCRAAGAGGASGAGGATAARGAGATGPGGARTGGTGAAGPGGATGAGTTGGAGAGSPAGAGTAGGTGAGGTAGAGAPLGAGVGATGAASGAAGAGGASKVGADAASAGAVSAGSGGAARLRPYFVPLLEQVLGLPPSSSPTPSLECPPPVQSESLLQLASPLPAPSPYAGPTGGLAERREPESRPASRRVPLPSPQESSLPALADPTSDYLRAAIPTNTSLLATVFTDPSFESTAASALVAKLVDFAAHCRLDYATSLVAESESVCPPFVGGECALSTDVLEDRQEEFQCFAVALPHLVSMLLAPEGDPDAPDIPTPRSYAEAIEGPYSSQWQSAMDAEMASWKSTGTYTFSPTPKITTLRVLLHVAAQRDYELHSLDFNTAFLQGSMHEEIWLRRPPGFTGSFPPSTQWSLRWPVYGLRRAPHEWHDTLWTMLAALGFAPSTADPSLFLRTDTLLPLFYILVYVDDLVFATAHIAGLAHVKSELQKRHTCTDLGELRSYLGLQITRDRARCTITLTQSHMVQQVLQRFDFTYSSPQATPLSTRHSLSALPSDESVEPSGPYPELVGYLMYLMISTRPDLAYPLSILARFVAPGRHRPEHMAAAKRVLRYLCSTSGMGLVLGGRSPVVLTGHADASWVDDQATQRSSQGYTFSLGSGSVSWRSTRSSSVLSSCCEAEIYAGAMAAQELRWLTYLLTDLGEPPRSPPVLYVDNKAMLALCREHRLEHRTKHIALRYFLARELQQRGQLRLAYVASQANIADIFTKALQPCDH
ncbi:unnamed protein product [Closterium sp. NIES-53]